MPGVETSIESPCTRICVMHPKFQLCSGCGRSLDEIAHWIELSSAERRRIKTELARRLAAMTGDETPPVPA
jgi:hypothetical protein